MSIKDEKEWLRAILEGKIKPGDAEWEKVWKEEDFAGVRRVLRDVGMMKQDDLVMNRAKMWRVVEGYRRQQSLSSTIASFRQTAQTERYLW